MSALPTNTGTTNPLGNVASAFTPQSGEMTGRQSTLSEWVGPYVADMLGKAKALTAEPYQVYQGPLTAAPSELQQKYFQGLGQMGFPGQLGQTFSSTGAPTLPTMTATGMTGGAAQPTGIAAQYMNPYLSAVLSPQLSELQRQAQIAQMNTGSKLTQAGAFGGSRQAIMDAETQRNLLRQMNETIGTGYATAYDKALQQFNTEQGQAKGLAELLGRAGTEQRGIESEGIKADLAAFEEQRDAPYKQIQFEQSLLQGLPIQSVAASYQQPSTATNVLNTMGGLMGLYEKLFPKK
jgi:hypothetical protein